MHSIHFKFDTNYVGISLSVSSHCIYHILTQTKTNTAVDVALAHNATLALAINASRG